MESLKNEAESLRYVRQHTDIPVPTVSCGFEDDDAYYLVTGYIEGVSMSDLTESQKAVVREEVERQLRKLRNLKSNRLGGPSGIVVPPHRVLHRAETGHQWHLEASDVDEYVFCHNDLSQQNVIVDPETLTINAIIDWEYSGLYPARSEWPFYTRLGPFVAVGDKVDDSLTLLGLLEAQCTR